MIDIDNHLKLHLFGTLNMTDSSITTLGLGFLEC